jgi:hypothetical protein
MNYYPYDISIIFFLFTTSDASQQELKTRHVDVRGLAVDAPVPTAEKRKTTRNKKNGVDQDAITEPRPTPIQQKRINIFGAIYVSLLSAY